MIKQAASQHPHGLTKLQHRLLYESDSDSSFDLTFSSPSSIGSNSEYSDVGYQSSSRSRTSSHGLSRRMAGHASRSESISSVLGCSIAIQRVLMGTNPPLSSSKKSQRQSVRAIASAFEEAGRTGVMGAPNKIGTQLSRLDEVSAPANESQSVQSAPTQASDTSFAQGPAQAAGQPNASLSPQSNSSFLGRSAAGHGPVPARLKITKQPLQGPLSAPATITTTNTMPNASAQPADLRESSLAQAQFVFPPRSSGQKRWPFDEPHPRIRSFISLDDQYDDDEPAFDIVPSPSRRRNFPLSSAATPPTAPAQLAHRAEDNPRASLSASASAGASVSTSLVDSSPPRSCHSAASRDSMDSTYSFDSLSGHPFSLQLPDRDHRVSSSASFLDLDDIDSFTSPFIGSSSSCCNAGPINPPTDADDADEVSRQQVEISPPTPTTVPVVQDQLVSSPRASASTLQPLLLSTSRPSSSSSSSTTTLTPSALAAAPMSMRVNDDTSFPLPPFTAARAASSVSISRRNFSELSDRFKDTLTLGTTQPMGSAPSHTLDLGSESGADQSLAITELKREAQALLDSIRSLSDEIDSSIPPTHRLPGSAYRLANAKPCSSSASSSSSSSSSSSGGAVNDETRASFVAVDESYSDTWRLMDAWYWSSFELGSPSSSSLSPTSF
ncbi:uncharacterized protein UTRI_04317 [Ustilago trichophora]|uniref:Uncharacterized protein n=1 Tax=Ustilago trichophora TaxID=86804 RepID=A0A5C3EPQ8_9BASI|nr:uncharacterized protein UTRI_04317 [Ustilago trichophora]